MYNYQDYSDTSLQLSILAIVATFSILLILLAIAIYVVKAIFLMKLFKKTGVVEGWMAWVPFLNNWKLLELGGYPGWIVLLPLAGFIPFVGWASAIVSVVFLCMAAYQVGLKFGKTGPFLLLYFFLEIVWAGILGVGKAEFNEDLGRPMTGSLEGKWTQTTTGSNEPAENPYS